MNSKFSEKMTAKQMIQAIKDKKTHKCPRCGLIYQGVGALSRRDNKTMICPSCGLSEALLDFTYDAKKLNSEKDKMILKRLQDKLIKKFK